MQDSGRTQDFVSTGCPPVTHKPSTACSAGRAKKCREVVPKRFFSSRLIPVFRPAIQAPRVTPGRPG